LADFKELIRADQEGNVFLICKYRVKVKVNGWGNNYICFKGQSLHVELWG
jgi:hypothetical protein